MNFKNSIIQNATSPTNGHEFRIDLDDSVHEHVGTVGGATVGELRRKVSLASQTRVCCWPLSLCSKFTRKKADNADDMISSTSRSDPTNPNHRHKHFDTTVKETFASLADSGSGLYFSVGAKKIDFVLVYNKLQLNVMQEKQRQYFQENLIKDGLELESEYPEPSSAEGQIFVKIHAPWKTLCRQAELLHMKMPLRIQDQIEDRHHSNGNFGNEGGRALTKICRRLVNNAMLTVLGKTTNKVTDFGGGGSSSTSPDATADEASKNIHVTQHFSRKKLNRFNIVDKATFFSPTQRVELVWEILQSARNSPDDERSRGVESLLEKRIFVSAFPMHDGDCETPADKSPSAMCQRQILRRTWANPGCALRSQPLELIRNYYGVKIGFYFAFLGFYTKWLIFPAIGGTLCFLYGLASAASDKIVEDFCDEQSEPGNFTMCPVCQPPHCEPFLMAHEGCKLIKWDIRMDNEATLALACLSVIWATAFIKMWKRREAELAFEWDTYDLDHQDVVIRPEYEEHAKERKENPITREMEPFIPRSTKILWLCVSVLVTIFLLLCVTAMLVALVLVRILLYGAYRHLGGTFTHFNVEWSRWTVHGMIFVTVVIFEKIYHSVAMKLTSWECPKTESDFISSFLWKVFLFELVNDFVPISYAAWFKGRLLDTPLDLDFKSELCDPGGCMAEVVELIAVLLLARLVVGNIAEVGIPFLKNSIEHKMSAKKSEAPSHSSLPQYRKDFQLEELELDGVVEEYMEMIVQFAFVTLFVPAFPLAGLVCLLNNVAEIRVDAINFVTAHRRPLPIRVPGIQIWNKFLDIITKLAILVNAALIAFTSELLPRIVYRNNRDVYKNYGEFSLSSIAMEDFHDHEIEHYMNLTKVTRCYYQDYRQSEEGHAKKVLWWEIMLLRVTGFAVFTVLFFTFHWLFNFLVSDTPASVETKIRRRKFVVSKASDNEMLDKWLAKNGNVAAASTDRQKTSVWSQAANHQLDKRLKDADSNVAERVDSSADLIDEETEDFHRREIRSAVETGSLASVSNCGPPDDPLERNRLDSLTSNSNHPHQV